MKVLISGICGFAGSTIAHRLLESSPGIALSGFDNFSRPGSELNRELLQKRGAKLFHADIRSVSDMEMVPAADWIIDTAANPSVGAGVDAMTSSRQLLEHNLYGTVNIMELAKRHRAGCILLSTSRVYSIDALSQLPLSQVDSAYRVEDGTDLPPGASAAGIAEQFSTRPPISLYGSTKLASEFVALEYGETFDFPVWVNRCGVLAGAGQFGRPDQGIFAFWINSYLRRRPLRYIGYAGRGLQTRDALHPGDLVPLLLKQMRETSTTKPRVINLGGGAANARSLAQVSAWCAARFGEHTLGVDPAPRAFDVPWLVMDARLAHETWDWEPQTPIEKIFEEIALHAEQHPRWLETSAPL